jgi:hypothetical protein
MGCTELLNEKQMRARAKFCSDACRQRDGREMRRNKPQTLCDHCKKVLHQKD